MKVLGIMGSPRIKGNSDLLLDEALKGAQSQGAEAEKIVVDKLQIAPCKEYYGCLKDGNCVIRDDMDDLYLKILDTDAIIVASPIFFYTVSAQLMLLISRCQALWARKYVLKNMDIPLKKGAFIAVGATKGEKLFDGPKLTIKYFFQAINAGYTEELLIRGVDKRGEIKEHPDALADAYVIGKKLVTG
ncbi:MAG: flavodoxin family protein [Dehalococcoidales bacterium]|nr:flavodoxin family protein [Dehalococcoidales bacterium]